MFQETSESPQQHAVGVGAVLGGGLSSSSAAAAAAAAAAAVAAAAAAHEQQQPQTSPPPPLHLLPCLYCGAAFPNQSKLTRHMLSHSLKSLEYRDPPSHAALHHLHLLSAHDHMGTLAQAFPFQINAAMAGCSDPQEQAAAVAAALSGLEMDLLHGASTFLEAAAGASGAPGTSGASGRLGLSSSSTSGNGGIAATSASLLLGSAAAASGLGGSGMGGSSGGGRGDGIGGSGGDGRGGRSSSPSTSAAASAAAQSGSSAASLLGASSDPNSVVMCKFCAKSFPDVTSLITHLSVHTGDRPFKCEFCGKAFKLRHHMKDHCRVHTGKFPLAVIPITDQLIYTIHINHLHTNKHTYIQISYYTYL